MWNQPRASSMNEAMFKLIIVGNSGTGKSCLMNRYVKDVYIDTYKVTIGVQFASKTIDIDKNYAVKLQIWDTAGQQSFQSIVKSFYRNSAAVFLVYNITNKSSFQSLSSWVIQARENSPQNAILVLIGTHLDQQNKRQVNKDQAIQFTNKQGISLFFQTSSKNAINVNQAFEQVGKQLFMQQVKCGRNQEENNKNSIELKQKDVGSHKICC